MNQTYLSVYREIQKLVAFLVVFLGAYLCQILKQMNLISLGSFAFLVYVMIQKLQDLDRMPIKKCSTRNFYFSNTYKKSRLVMVISFGEDQKTSIGLLISF